MGKVRVVFCDDNEVVRVTLSRALKFKKGIEVVGEVESFEALESVIADAKPDVILLDVNMPGIDGVHGINLLRAAGHDLPIIVMSADKRNEGAAIQAGAAGFFYKGTTDLDELVRTLVSAAG